MPKRALSASATCPAGTIGIGAVGVAVFGMISGAGVPPEPNASPRVPCPGAIKVEGVVENSEFCPDDCAETASGPASERMSARTEPRAGHSRPGAAFAVALLMTRSFSA